MKNRKNRTISTIVLILLLAAAGMMLTATSASAQTASSSLPTNAYIVASPNPAGVGQQVALEMWLVQFNPIAATYMGGHWQDYTVLITAPDGKTQTLGPFTADDASFAHTLFTPTQIGNYTIKFIFPGQHVVGPGPFGGTIDAYYGASSFTITLTVQQQPVEPTPQTALPTGYWQNPINSQNQLWYTISGNWLAACGSQGGPSNAFRNDLGNFNPYTTAPNSAHIVWANPLMFGGLIGGEFGGSATSHYYTGKSYEQPFTPPVVINGVLYYNTPVTPKIGFCAVDLRTGKTLWTQNNTVGITNGQVLNFLSPNQEGGIPYLWYMGGSTYYMYDANTGNLAATVTNGVSVGFNGAANCVEGPNGELLAYVLGNNCLAMWNSTLCMIPPSGLLINAWTWRPSGTYAWSAGVQWNVTETTYPGESIWEIGSGVVLATTGSIIFSQNWQMEIGYDANTGAQLWVQNRTTPTGNTAYGLMGTIGDDIYTEYNTQTMTWTGYNIHTGQKAWGPSTPDTNPWGSIADNSGLFAQVAYGTLYGQAVDGIHALNNTNGQTLWDFYGDNSGANFPGMNTYPFETNGLYTVADGKVIAATGDSHGVPQFRGANLYVINAFTGQQVWKINGYYQCIMPVADGYLLAFNNYDNQLYCFGTGASKTTVTATPGVNGGVTIQGTVTDISAGASQQAVATNFPNGLPCISDEGMTPFMEAVYMQQPMPTNAIGVPLTLYVSDSTGAVVATIPTQSDITGHYAASWTPTSTGIYTVTASFSGTNSYFASVSETSLAVGGTSSGAAAGVTGLSTNSLGMYIIIATVVIVIAIAVAVLVLRKRPKT